MLLPFYYIYIVQDICIIHYTLSLISASNQISSRINSQEDKEKDGETPQRTTAITEDR